MRCKAKAKSTGEQCKSYGAYGGPVCRVHGARRPETVKRGNAHYNYKHGKFTKESQAETLAANARWRELMDFAATEAPLMGIKRMTGGKPGVKRGGRTHTPPEKQNQKRDA